MTGRLWWGSGQSFDPDRESAGTNGDPDRKSVEIPDIVEFTRQRLGFDPNPLPELVLRGGRRVNCTRQWGKSTVEAAKAVHHAYCQPDSLDTGAGSERKAERRVRAQGGRIREPAGDQSSRRRRKRNLDRVSE